MQRFKCTRCNFIYNPRFGDTENDILAGTAFDDLPYEWACPGCASSMDFFEPLNEEAVLEEAEEGSSE